MNYFLKPDGSLSAAISTEIIQQTLPPGFIMYSASANAGAGWLLADGSEVSRVTYPNLFIAIGTNYGAGNGTTTFALPDIRGRSPMGQGGGVQGGALTYRDITTKYLGEEEHTQSIPEMPIHHHGWSGPLTRTGGHGSGANVLWNSTLPAITDDTGGGQPFNVIHPSIILFGFIKT